MNKKIPSAITEIKLNRAVFTDVSVEQLTFINFFYGNNGAGKSSIANAIKEDDGIEWVHGKSAADYDVLVYNQDFINRNFSDYDNLPGVFTVNEVNIKLQQEAADKAENKRRLEFERTAALEEWRQKQNAPYELLTEFQNNCWSKTAAIRSDFDSALRGKKQKKSFADAILCETDPQEHDLAELKRLCDIAFDDTAKVYKEFSKVKTPEYGKLPGKDLLDKVIVSSGNTPFAQFMNALNASDWVRAGHADYTGSAGGKCPYCQQKLPADFEEEIAACFDEQYQQNIYDLQHFQRTYNSETADIIKRFEDNMTDFTAAVDLTEYKTKLDMLKKLFEINNRRLNEKAAEPARIIALEDTDSLLLEIGDLIDGINRLIRSNNEVVAQKQNSRNNCRKQIIQHLAFMLSADVKSYYSEVNKAENEAKNIESKGKQIKKNIDVLTEEIAQLNSQIVNTESAITDINKILKDSGFQGFCLRAKEGVKNTYEIIRDDHKNGGPVKGLSEGERNFIAFLYFFHMVRGSMSRNEVKEKIVVIDDPVSGMDSAALFIVSSIVREMISICRNNTEYSSQSTQGNNIKQLFILTHNAHFHQEITCQQTGYYNCASFYYIRKSNNISAVNLCDRPSTLTPGERENYNPVHNSYTALWEELRDISSAIPALNVMRRIIGYYFLQLCGYDGSDLRRIVLEQNKDRFIIQTEDGQQDMTYYQLASSMLAYINDPHGISGSFSYAEECGDTEAYRHVFELIFEALGQKRHYCMMTGTPLI